MSTPTLPLLYSFRRCPYAIRARMALRYAGVAFEVHEVALRQKPQALLVVSPKGTVPVLVLHQGQVIHESLEIMAWALHQSDPKVWYSPGTADAVLRWTQLNDYSFKPLLDRYKYPARYPEQSQAVYREHALDLFIRPLDAVLRNTPQLLGTGISMADVALFPFVRQFAMVDQNWFDQQPLPGVQQWLAAWLTSELFAAVMDKPAAATLAA